MNRLSMSLSVAALALASLALSAEDFQPLMKTTQATWPEKRHIGVICNYRANEAQVWALARAAGEGALITVVDARTADQSGAAALLLANQKADYLVLMPGDRYFRDGSFAATVAVNHLASRGVPAIGTTPVALKQGAVFSVGDGTEGQILVTDRLIGTVDVILPDPKASEKASLVLRREGMATVSVRAAE
ncbi:MAG: hypothetical protein HXX12_03125 [Geothrix sp.]|uniref:hypothetical protein n=1 Tax=Geothrix sp. TaxID=1962974 RepID=UPI00184B03DA|nr:hypothetical protein [Geothrix sp.]NWJ39950.1 hypothetical protein [Geothrix sp.]WIL22038.1 MAG: hypothetical protein QOZ81_001325 [Geothrix sp.]